MSRLSSLFGLDRKKNKALRNAINAFLRQQFTDDMRRIEERYMEQAEREYGLTRSQAQAAWAALMKALKVSAVVLVLCGGAWAQRAPVAITAPESLSAGQSGALTLVVTNTNPMAGTEITPALSTVVLSYTDGDQQRTATAETTINVVRSTPGTPWLKPSVTLALPAPLVLDANSVQFSGAPGASYKPMGGGAWTFTAPSLPAGATWTTTATVRNP